MNHLRKTLLLLLFVLPSLAQTQADLNEQSAQSLKKSDDALNSVYKDLLAKLDPEGKKKLQAAEKAWIAFRDADCASQADDYRGGSIMPLIYNTAAQHLTDSRTSDLQSRFKEMTSH